MRPRRHERIVHRAESSGSQPHDKGRILWICGRVLRTGASPAGRVDSPWTTRTRCPPPAHTLAPLAHKLHRTNHPVILTRQHRTTLRRGCLHRPFRTTSASHSNPSQHRPRPGSPPNPSGSFPYGIRLSESCPMRHPRRPDSRQRGPRRREAEPGDVRPRRVGRRPFPRNAPSRRGLP